MLALAAHGLVAVSVARTHGTSEFARRDWSAFRDAGARVLDGDTDALYAARPGGFPFLHPPPVAVAFAPLGRLSDAAFFATMSLLSVLGLALSIASLRLLGAARGELDIVALGLVASAPWAIGLVLGQPTALLLASWLGGLALCSRGRGFTAGLAFGVAALKPPFIVAPLAWALATRRWRVLGGISLALGLGAALSLVLGLSSWSAWFDAALRTLGHVSGGELALWKQHTWLAFAIAVMPRWLAWVSWAALAWLAAVLLARRRRRGVRRESLLGTGGRLALATLAFSPYGYFYDAILLAIPAAALFVEREGRTRAWRLTLGALALSTFAWEHIGFFGVQAGPPFGGALVMLWLLTDLASPPGEPAPTPDGGSDHATTIAP